MTSMPMLADFALRLAGGLAAALLLTPGRVVPPAFFRTHCLVILGLLVLAGLDASRAGAGAWMVSNLVIAAVSSYFAAVAFGLGLARIGLPLTTLVVADCAVRLLLASRAPDPRVCALNFFARLASAWLLGATLTAMLLGHYYLTAPAMSIEPLKRFVRGLAWGLGARAVLAGLGLGLWLAGRLPEASGATAPALFLAVRWGMGLIGPAVAVVLTWKTVEIRSTQSATGILYIAMTLVLFGELSAMVLSRSAGVAF
jgi:hypothetical protein